MEEYRDFKIDSTLDKGAVEIHNDEFNIHKVFGRYGQAKDYINGFADGIEMKEAQTLLIRNGQNTEQVARLLPQIRELANYKSIDLITATKQVIKSFQ